VKRENIYSGILIRFGFAIDILQERQ